MVLHHGCVPEGDREDRGGYHVTTPLRTLIDIASSPQSWPFLDDAVRDALRTGAVRRRDLLSANVPPDAAHRLQSALDLAADKAGIP